MGGGLGPLPGGIHGLAAAVDDVRVKGVLHVGGRIVGAPEPVGIRLVFREQQLGRAVAVQPVGTIHRRMLGDDQRLG